MSDPRATLPLRFKPQEDVDHVEDALHRDLSTACRAGDSLFVSCDETAGVDRLTPADDGWGNHRHFNFGEMIDLPAGPDGEMDIEGMAVSDGWLWVCGSHSLIRGPAEEGVEALAGLIRQPNRFFLGRFPLVERDGAMEPVARDGERVAQHLKLSEDNSVLKKWLKDDPHLGPAMTRPCKENGFDIEGIEARGTRVWLGLRGPVLLEHGVILQLDMKVTKDGHLKPRKQPSGQRYSKHFVPTKGQGVRDLAFDGDDLLILTGTVMAGDGPSEVLRWPGAAQAEGDRVEEAVKPIHDMPYRGEHDHPEGLVAWPEEDGWLVVYDSPAPERLTEGEPVVTADIWRF